MPRPPDPASDRTGRPPAAASDRTARPAAAAQRRTGRPPVTSRAEILEAARQLIDRDGWEKLTIRRLATELGIGATTLYHHIRNKEDLLVLLLNQHLGGCARTELPADPRERIIAASLAGYDALAGWPWAAEILTRDGFVGLLDESALWHVEGILSGAVGYGCTPEHSVYIMRTIWYYTVGEILVRAHSPYVLPDGELPSYRPTLDPAQVPHLAAVRNQWHALSGQDTYPLGLRALVDGLLAQTVPQASG
ncbi:TetR/AcrR family transcriptional regulator [Streptomyces sp. NPDC051561]|uniref:TetR/AcrR family transcriptional regulator n=1 Tax=Streptomyces sp. NPDC051561 TaxID=3365658 RepID=UPI0037B66A22